MSNTRISQPAKAAWRPLDVLQNTTVSNSIFLPDDYSKPRASRFKEWSPERVASLPDTISKTNSTTDEINDGLVLEDNKRLTRLEVEKFEKNIADAYQNGLKAGIEKGKAESQEAFDQLRIATEITEFENIKNLLQEISEATWALRENPVSLFEPLKRLSIHIAEQLILTELTTSPASIQALIERCVETLDIANSTQVLVELNPSDLALFQTKLPMSEGIKTWRLQADPTLIPGSLRVRADDAMVSDLVEHRLESLAQRLLTDSTHWRAQTAFQADRLSARRGLASTVEDAFPHDSNSKEATDFENSTDSFEDISDGAPTDFIEEHTNIADLELPAKLVNDDTDSLGTRHE